MAKITACDESGLGFVPELKLHSCQELIHFVFSYRTWQRLISEGKENIRGSLLRKEGKAVSHPEPFFSSFHFCVNRGFVFIVTIHTYQQKCVSVIPRLYDLK